MNKRISELTPSEKAAFEFAKAFFDVYAPYIPQSEIDYCSYNFKEMWKTDFKDHIEDEDLKDWLINVILIWPDDLYVITEESEEEYE